MRLLCAKTIKYKSLATEAQALPEDAATSSRIRI